MSTNWSDDDPQINWRQRAACRNAEPELFETPLGRPSESVQVRIAKWICKPCPVKAQCLTQALANREYGIWGGTTEAERNAMRKHGKAAS